MDKELKMITETPQRIEVLDYGDPRMIWLAGKCSYGKEFQTHISRLDKDDKEIHRFIFKLISKGHLSPLEFASITVRLVTNRAIANEITRHRLCSFMQESTRYVKINEPSVTTPLMESAKYISNNELDLYDAEGLLNETFEKSFNGYTKLINAGVQAEHARDILPLALTTRLYIRANYREWRHIFEVRLFNKGAHWLFRCLMATIYEDLNRVMPYVFGDMLRDYADTNDIATVFEDVGLDYIRVKEYTNYGYI